jgi:D-sedoheptulose 7-phosphate isomerase
MTMLEQRIQQQFFEAADLFNDAAAVLPRVLARAAEAIVGCFTAGGKVLVAGGESGAALAPLLAAAFTHRFERERPPLAAIALRHEAPLRLAQQVQALGQPGDVLLAIDVGGPSAVLLEAVQRGRSQDMVLVVLTGADPGPWSGWLGEADVLVSVPHARVARVAETLLLVLHCLCDAVDLQLMGELETE